MFISKIEIENIRSLGKLTWRVPGNFETGWHVVLGDNGAGKSSLLKAICLAMVGPSEAGALRQPWEEWLNRNELTGKINLELGWSPEVDNFSGSGNTPSEGSKLPVKIKFTRSSETTPQVELSSISCTPSPKRHIWNGGKGWFAASYGPFRRFTGGDPQTEKMYYSKPRLARHLSLFDERVALTECLGWLRALKFKELESDFGKSGDAEGSLLQKVRQFLNESGFLPANVTLGDVSSDKVEFNDANGVDVAVEELSDGYRSILSMTFELIRQMSNQFGAENVFSSDDPTVVVTHGVVVIDEVDAHLHPTWQRKIGHWFTKHFPNIQFIVSTHSPLVCQSAEKGSIFLLPEAGADRQAKMLVGQDFNRLVYGNVLDAYGTDAFGASAALTRSEESKDKHQRLADLNNKEILKQLAPEEKVEQENLRSILPSVAPSLKLFEKE